MKVMVSNLKKEIINDDIGKILNEVANRYGLVRDKLVPIIGGYQNLVYEYIQNDKSYILRLSNFSTRNTDEINSELDWCSHLIDYGVPLSKPLLSLNGLVTELVNYNEIKITATLFEKARGAKLSYPEYLNNVEVFKELGRITGRIHNASKEYVPKNKMRHEWLENYYLKNVYNYIPEEKIKIRNTYKNLVNYFKALPHDNNSFGLIHGDINVGNFCISNNEITLFDFDECQYSWFVEDIAIQLFYTVYPFGDDAIDERQAMADKFIKYFMSGYYLENDLDDYWLKKIPEFLKLRELIVHVGIYKKWDLKNLSQWQKDYYTQSAARIEKGIPLVEFKEQWLDIKF